MIYLDTNGVTIKADKKARIGNKYDLNGEKYLVVDRKTLERMVKSGEDVTKVVTSKVKMMYCLFAGKNKFNQDISSWDVSNVNSMSFMFHNASSFNQDIGNWDVSNVNQMESMFDKASSFNCDISNWKIARYNNLRNMFASALSFNQPIGKWDVTGCDISYMFLNAKSFNQDLNNWNVKGTSLMISLFEGAESFNQDLNLWDLSENNYKGLSLNKMFKNAKNFNGDITTWKFKGITRMDEMFAGASSFNQDISVWDVSKVEKMDRLFNRAESFNQDLSSWHIHEKLKLKTPSGIFTGAKSFNPAYSPFQKKARKIDKSKEKLTKNDKNSFTKLKKLLKSRDFDKIDIGVELLLSLNNTELFNIMLDGCKLETIDDSETNNFESKLHTNDIFTGTGPAQPFLNYALMSIVISIPQVSDIKIDESLKLDNITRLNISTLFGDIEKGDIKFNINKFTSLEEIYIDFSKVYHYHFLAEKKDIDDCRIGFFKNNFTKKLVATNVEGSLRWLENFKQVQDLTLFVNNKFNNTLIQDLDSFSYLKNLKKLKMVGIGYLTDINFLSNCNNLECLSLSRNTRNNQEISLNNIDVISQLKNLENLEIITVDEQINLGVINKCKMIKELSLDVKNKSKINHLIGCENLKILNLKIDSSFDINDIDFSTLNGCKNLEKIHITGGHSYSFNGKIENINGIEIADTIKTVVLDKISFQTNVIMNNYYDEIIESAVKPDLSHQEKKFQLSSDKKKSLAKIKKLLLSRDIDNIDLGVEFLVGLNDADLFNILLDGCKLETIEDNETNNFETKLHTNKIFTGSGPAQPFLNYALLNIIGCIPENQNINIDNSLAFKNITSLNITSLNFYRLNAMFNIDKFTHLNKVIIHFSEFGKVNFTDYFKNSSVKEIIASGVGGSLKWLNNFKQLEVLKLSLSWLRKAEDYDAFNSLTSLKELEIDCPNEIDFLKNCYSIKKLRLNIFEKTSTFNIDALKHLNNIEELDIIDLTNKFIPMFSTASISNCNNLRKIMYKTDMYVYDDDLALIEKAQDNRFRQLLDILKNIKSCEILEHLTLITKDNQRFREEVGASLNLKVDISGFNGMVVLPNLKEIKINKIQLSINNSN